MVCHCTAVVYTFCVARRTQDAGGLFLSLAPWTSSVPLFHSTPYSILPLGPFCFLRVVLCVPFCSCLRTPASFFSNGSLLGKHGEVAHCLLLLPPPRQPPFGERVVEQSAHHSQAARSDAFKQHLVMRHGVPIDLQRAQSGQWGNGSGRAKRRRGKGVRKAVHDGLFRSASRSQPRRAE